MKSGTMMAFFEEFLRGNPVGLLFLVLGLGYLVGKMRIRGFDMGSISGVLFVGLIFGHFGYKFDTTVQSIGFTLFIFSVGLQAGPGFFSVIQQDGLKYLCLAVVIAGTGFALAIGWAKVLGLEPGAAAGLLAGGLTSSPTLAAAQEAVRAGQVPVPAGFTADQVMTNVTTAYAITYIFGLVGLILIIRFLPRILHLDLPSEAAKLEASRRGGAEDRVSVLNEIVVRAHRVTNEKLVGPTLDRIYERFPGRVTVERIRRRGELIPLTLETQIELGDEVCIVGYLDEFIARAGNVGPELSDAELLDVRIESCRAVLLRSKIKKVKKVTTSLAKVAAQRGCFISKIQRLGVDIPLEGDIVVQAGDVVHITGPASRVEAFGNIVGHIEREAEQTDLVTFSLGITAGLLIGTWTVTVAGISVGLGTAGGLLAAGLVIGYLRALHPTFGRVPGAARWIFMELGLMTFMAGVGLRAGSGILETLAQSGLSLFIAGMCVTTIPVLVGYVFGRRVLSINPVMLLGAITGSMTSGASLSIVNAEAKSSVPSLGYTGAYAFANVLLTVAGSVILLL
ncbi:MAG: transporter [Woeseiaceae bacterium]|nr:transporter [Woeseiaceae bacterium]